MNDWWIIDSYRPLWWLLLLPPLLAAGYWSRVNRPGWKKYLALALRLAGMVLLILALCRPYSKISGRKTHTAYWLDVSASIDPEAVRQGARDILADIAALPGNHSHRIYLLGDGLKEIDIEVLRQLEKQFPQPEELSFYGATKLSEALKIAPGLFPADAGAELILLSDGVATDDGAGKALKARLAGKLAVYQKKLAPLAAAEGAIVDFSADRETAYPGSTVRFRVKLVANADLPGKVKLINREIAIAEQPVVLKANQPVTVGFDLPVGKENGALWQAEFLPERDHFPENNRAVTTVTVQGEPKVLALHRQERELRSFVRALAAQGIQVTGRGRFGFPATLEELLEFDAVWLADFPAENLSESQMQMLQNYVEEFGRGLVMSGSENSFGLGGYYQTPVEHVLPVVSRYEKEEQQPSMALVLIIDKSGSMDGRPIQLAQQAAKAAIDLLSPQDEAGVVAFDNQPWTVVDLKPIAGNASPGIAIDGIVADGGTELYPAMEVACELLQRSSCSIRHAIILSDGQSMPGDFASLATLMAGQGMTLSTVALGEDADRALLENLAQIGRGRYYPVDDAETVPRIFVRETLQASRSAIREEPVLAAQVGKAEFLNGIDFDAAPPLLGYVQTSVKPQCEVQLLTDGGEPLLATGRFGLGQSAAFTSGITSQWASEWLQWHECGKLFGQLLRSLMSSGGTGSMQVEADRLGNRLELYARVLETSGAPAAEADLRALRLIPGRPPEPLAAEPVGFGRFRLETMLPDHESCSILLQDPSGGARRTLHYNYHYPAEYNLSAEPVAEIAALPEFIPGQPRTGRSVSLWYGWLNGLSIAGLLLLMAGIACRRL